TSGSSCATIGSPTASSAPTMTLSITAVTPGTNLPTSHGGSCPLDCANGPTSSDQRDLVLHHAKGHDPQGNHEPPKSGIPNAKKPWVTPRFLAKSITCSDQFVATNQWLPNT